MLPLRGYHKMTAGSDYGSFACFFFLFRGSDTYWNFLLSRWFVLDAETRDLVSIHTDGNEQLSVMRYSVGRQTCTVRVILINQMDVLLSGVKLVPRHEKRHSFEKMVSDT